MKPLVLKVDYGCCGIIFSIVVDFLERRREIHVNGIRLPRTKFCPRCGAEIPYPKVNGQISTDSDEANQR